MRGLPRNIKIKLLEHDLIPDLPKMLLFVQRYQVIQDYSSDSCNAATASSNDGNPGSTSDANNKVAILFVIPVENLDTSLGTATKMLLVGHHGQTNRT